MELQFNCEPSLRRNVCREKTTTVSVRRQRKDERRSIQKGRSNWIRCQVSWVQVRCLTRSPATSSGVASPDPQALWQKAPGANSSGGFSFQQDKLKITRGHICCTHEQMSESISHSVIVKTARALVLYNQARNMNNKPFDIQLFPIEPIKMRPIQSGCRLLSAWYSAYLSSLFSALTLLFIQSFLRPAPLLFLSDWIAIVSPLLLSCEKVSISLISEGPEELPEE